MSKYEYDEDGNAVCFLCNGTAYDDNVMQSYTNYVSKEDLRKYGVHFCSHCGFAGKVEWIDHARGVSKAKGTDAEYFHDLISTFVALYSFTDYSPIEEIIDLNDAVERNEVRENIFNHLKKEISGSRNPGHTFMLDRELFPKLRDLRNFDPDDIYDLHINGGLRHYLNELRSIAAARLVLEVIDHYLGGMNVLPTKGMDKVRYVVDEFFYNQETPIHVLIDDDIRYALGYAIDDVDYLAQEMGLNNFDYIVKLVKDAEERTRYVATRKELEEAGLLFFD